LLLLKRGRLDLPFSPLRWSLEGEDKEENVERICHFDMLEGTLGS